MLSEVLEVEMKAAYEDLWEEVKFLFKVAHLRMKLNLNKPLTMFVSVQHNQESQKAKSTKIAHFSIYFVL